jgi:hypothetical protein
LGVAEKSVHLDDVWVVKETLDLDFADHLDEQFLVDVLFIYSFERTDEPAFLVLGDEDFTELPRPKFPSQLEVLNLHEGSFGLFLLFNLGRRPGSGDTFIKLSFFFIEKNHLKDMVVVGDRLFVGINLRVVLKRFAPINETSLVPLVL